VKSVRPPARSNAPKISSRSKHSRRAPSRSPLPVLVRAVGIGRILLSSPSHVRDRHTLPTAAAAAARVPLTGSSRGALQFRSKRPLDLLERPAKVSAPMSAHHQDESKGSRTSGVACFSPASGRAAAGNCSTVARWPSHRRVSSTTCPSGNSNAS
jgi:hypothetical protein